MKRMIIWLLAIMLMVSGCLAESDGTDAALQHTEEKTSIFSMLKLILDVYEVHPDDVKDIVDSIGISEEYYQDTNIIFSFNGQSVYLIGRDNEEQPHAYMYFYYDGDLYGNKVVPLASVLIEAYSGLEQYKRDGETLCITVAIDDEYNILIDSAEKAAKFIEAFGMMTE